MTQGTERLHVAGRVILFQVLVAVIVAAIVYASKGWVEGYSVMLGALTGIIPISLFALIAFRSTGQDANMALTTLYSGLLLKYVLTAGLFILVIVAVKPISTLMVLIGLITTQVVSALAPALGQK